MQLSSRPSWWVRNTAPVVAVAAIAVGLTACAPLTEASMPPSPVARTSPQEPPTPEPAPTSLPDPHPLPSLPPLPSPSPGVYLEIIQSDYGTVAILTEAGAVCTLTATRDGGTPIAGVRNPQVASWDGEATWVYPQPYFDGDGGMHVVTCSHRGLTSTVSASFVVPET